MPPSSHRCAGQASAEYVAILFVVALLLAGIAAAVSAPWLGPKVVGAIRHAICVVWGDVCSPEQARREGLAPCVVQEDLRRITKKKAAVVSWTNTNRTTRARRSDGTVMHARSDDNRLGGGPSVGIDALGVRIGLDGEISSSFVSGREWEFRDEASARGFEAAQRAGEDVEQRWPPTRSFKGVGAEVGVEPALGVAVGRRKRTPASERPESETRSQLTPAEQDREPGSGARPSTGLGSPTRAAAVLGLRTGPGDETTVYTRIEAGAGVLAALPGIEQRLGADVLLEYTRVGGEPRELVLRSFDAAHGGRQVEWRGRLDLRRAENRALAWRIVNTNPRAVDFQADVKYALDKMVKGGSLERAVYAIEEEEDKSGGTLNVGVELGSEERDLKRRRRLLSAQVWVGGSQARERVDCLLEG